MDTGGVFVGVPWIGVCRRRAHAERCGQDRFRPGSRVLPQELRELSCRATLDVPGSAARAISGWLATHRKQVTAKLWDQAAACSTQTVLVLR